MNRTLIAVLGGAAVAALISTSSSAQPRLWDTEPHWYVSGQVGATFLDDADNTSRDFSVESEHKTGFGIAGAVGFELGDGFRVEGEIGYRQNDLDTFRFTDDGGMGGALGVGLLDGRTVSADGDTSALSFMANLFYDFELGTPLRPYFGGGIGIARVWVNDAAIVVDSIKMVIADDGDTVFAWQVGGGLGYTINPQATVSLDYRYFATEDPRFTDVLGGRFDSEYSTHNVSLNLRFRY